MLKFKDIIIRSRSHKFNQSSFLVKIKNQIFKQYKVWDKCKVKPYQMIFFNPVHRLCSNLERNQSLRIFQPMNVQVNILWNYAKFKSYKVKKCTSFFHKNEHAHLHVYYMPCVTVYTFCVLAFNVKQYKTSSNVHTLFLLSLSVCYFYYALCFSVHILCSFFQCTRPAPDVAPCPPLVTPPTLSCPSSCPPANQNLTGSIGAWPVSVS